MAGEREDLWQALLRTGEQVATEADYEHGYRREIRHDLRRYVTFTVNDEVYGLSIEDIVEISTRFDTTPVPRTADFVLGIGNVRGQVMPVIDLPRRLNLGQAAADRRSRVLIIKHEGEAFGIVVDRVLEVISLAPEELEEAPGGIGATRADFIAALGRFAGQLVIVLNLDTVLEESDFILPRFRADRGDRRETKA